jgi:hypothetical protein
MYAGMTYATWASIDMFVFEHESTLQKEICNGMLNQ